MIFISYKKPLETKAVFKEMFMINLQWFRKGMMKKRNEEVWLQFRIFLIAIEVNRYTQESESIYLPSMLKNLSKNTRYINLHEEVNQFTYAKFGMMNQLSEKWINILISFS